MNDIEEKTSERVLVARTWMLPGLYRKGVLEALDRLP